MAPHMTFRGKPVQTLALSVQRCFGVIVSQVAAAAKAGPRSSPSGKMAISRSPRSELKRGRHERGPLGTHQEWRPLGSA